MTEHSADIPTGVPVEFDDAGPAETYFETRTRNLVAASTDAAEAHMASAEATSASQPESAAHSARQALVAGAHAYWFAELTDLAEASHRRLHDLGARKCKTFDCHLEFDSGSYSSSCPVHIADRRLGLSPGFTARKWCSLCDEDLSECPHRRERLYWVTGGPTSFGPCRICHAEACEHGPEVLYPAPVIGVIKQIDRIEEISYVDVPSQPLARLTNVPFGTNALKKALGPSFEIGMQVDCHHCLDPYHGLPEPRFRSASLNGED